MIKLPRAPGERESRWAHLLCGEVQIPAVTASASYGAAPAVRDEELAALKAEQARMASELNALRALVQRMAVELGIDPQV